MSFAAINACKMILSAARTHSNIAKKRNNDEDMLVHEKEETEWFDKMHPQREALDTFYPAEEDEEGEEDEEDEAAPMAATSNQQLRKRMKKRQRRGEK